MTSLVTPTSQENSVLKNFRSFLLSKNYSSSTIRNYLSDVSRYFDFILNPLSLRDISLKKGNSNLLRSKLQPPFLREVSDPAAAGEESGFNPETLSAYLKSISSDPNYSRYLSSLSKFFQFAQNQGLTKTNPLKSALKNKKPNFDEILNQYSEHLNKKNFSDATIRNYLNDIRQFSEWGSNQLNPPVPDTCLPAGRSSLKEGGSLKTAPFFKGSCPEQSEGLRGFKFFKSIFKKKEVSSES